MKTKFQEIVCNKQLMRVLEVFLEGGKIDISIPSIKEEVGIRHISYYNIISYLLKMKWIVKSRRVRNRQLYKLNYKNKCVKTLDKFYVGVITQ